MSGSTQAGYPWADPLAHPETTITAPGMDLAAILTAHARITETARLLAFPTRPAERRDLPAGWPDGKGRNTVVNRDPEGRAVLCRTLIRNEAFTGLDMVRMQVTRSPFLDEFAVEEMLMSSDLNLPSMDADHQSQLLWTHRLADMIEAVRRRILAHGRSAGDPHHEIAQTLHGRAAIRVRELLVRAGARNLPGISFRMTSPSPYGPVDCRMYVRGNISGPTIATLHPDVGTQWSNGLGSTIEMSVKSNLHPPTTILRSPETATLHADEQDPVVEIMRSVSAFPNHVDRPFVRTPRR